MLWATPRAVPLGSPLVTKAQVSGRSSCQALYLAGWKNEGRLLVLIMVALAPTSANRLLLQRCPFPTHLPGQPLDMSYVSTSPGRVHRYPLRLGCQWALSWGENMPWL